MPAIDLSMSTSSFYCCRCNHPHICISSYLHTTFIPSCLGGTQLVPWRWITSTWRATVIEVFPSSSRRNKEERKKSQRSYCMVIVSVVVIMHRCRILSIPIHHCFVHGSRFFRLFCPPCSSPKLQFSSIFLFFPNCMRMRPDRHPSSIIPDVRLTRFQQAIQFSNFPDLIFCSFFFSHCPYDHSTYVGTTSSPITEAPRIPNHRTHFLLSFSFFFSSDLFLLRRTFRIYFAIIKHEE